MAFAFKPDHSIKTVDVYEASYIKEQVPTFFTGCKSVLNIVDRMKIPRDSYYFAIYSKTYGWRQTPYDSQAKIRKLLLTKVWVEANVPTFGNNTKELKYEPLPPLLNLEVDETFRDLEDNIIDITVRGERHRDKIYFKASDVGKMLGIVNIKTTLMNDQTMFDRDVHYKTFVYRPRVHNVDFDPIDSNNQSRDTSTTLYLTFKGLTKLLFVRRHPIADHFQEWATDILYKARLGTQDQKHELVADVLGVGIKDIKAFLNTNVNTMPVVYLLILGKAKDLRETLNISDTFKDEEYIVKYGLTNDLKRRTMEHEKHYGKLPNVNLALKYHVYIDPFYLSTAESDIERYFKSVRWLLQHPKYTELASIPELMMDTMVHNEYKRLGQAYGGKLQDLQTQLANEQKINQTLKEYIDRQEHNHLEVTKTLKEQVEKQDQMAKYLQEQLEKQDARHQEVLDMTRDMLRTKEEMLNLYRTKIAS